MPASVSSEFVTLCRSQVGLIASLGATFSVVYLTEELASGGAAKLIPIVAYPETSVDWEENQGWTLWPEEMEAVNPTPRLLSPETPAKKLPGIPAIALDRLEGVDSKSDREQHQENNWQQPQIVLPLLHEGVVMGLLVSGRKDRPWNEREEAQMQRIAHSLAIACVLDRRSHWIQQQVSKQQQLQIQQYDAMHNLLHQFKSPLTALRTFGKLLMKRLLVEDKNREVAVSIVRESDRLSELLQHIDRNVDIGEKNLILPSQLKPKGKSEETKNTHPVEISQFSSIQLLPAANFLEPCSVAEVLNPLLDSARAIADECNLKLQAEIPANLPLVQANAKALREVLSNLLDNALKYTPAGRQIYIKVKVEDRNNKSPKLSMLDLPLIGIGISDSGSGIPPQDLEHLFERHYRGAKAETEIPGTGLGLAIAQDLVQEMQGEVQVFSPVKSEWMPVGVRKNDINKGTTFIVWLQVETKNIKNLN
ncbi:GAF domain-containing sensor histidine kinase [Kamptonema sp. UHCC 0994]|uniref:GAF domain-containing sensor histidine kinase n=1 Tax=Kamptonema sp. UHCC 0994 TaxID=3031329 RepID=UPI0023B9340A|nr:GAF domain-containing sensor histidine kinase [Kamptonema sp. UHCC 0994]